MNSAWIMMITVTILSGIMLSACDRKVSASPPGSRVSPNALTSTMSTAESSKLEPWQPVDEAFTGCENGCGVRVEGGAPGIVIQPGAYLGQQAYCPVSGVVFEVKESSPRRNVERQPVYVCCEGCAQYFDANRERIVTLRGLASSQRKTALSTSSDQ